MIYFLFIRSLQGPPEDMGARRTMMEKRIKLMQLLMKRLQARLAA